ncbi:MAG TPA: hypothetical protein VGS23_04610, partial [Thermoplasmata archaeon]|nr:hypothetical protein [Thermoplasmata archaeon]
MTIVTLVKVVPELDKMTFDPTTKTMRRAGAPLILNPFDEHAAIVAPTLRASGEAVVLVCMGPPDAKGPMTRALALGSDRALLISDRALAGSDTWVTSRVLAAALRPLAPDLVLAGRCSTDSSTGQVPSQLAELLGLPMVDGVSKISRRPSGSLEAIAETDAGWERFEVQEPCLVSVTEKVSKIRFPKPRELNEAATRPFEVKGASELGLAPDELGLAGSPTQVLSLENEEPTRSSQVFAEEALAERVQRAADQVRVLLARPRPRAAALRRPSGALEENGEVLVLASSENGGLDREALPLVSEVLRLPEPLWPSVVGFGPLSAEELDALSRAGAARAWWWPEPTGWLPPTGAAQIIADLLRERSRGMGALFLSTGWAREVAGRVSSRLGLGLTGDAVGMSWERERGLVFH